MVNINFIKSEEALKALQIILDAASLLSPNFNLPYDTDEQPTDGVAKNDDELLKLEMPAGMEIKSVMPPSANVNMGAAISSILALLSPIMTVYGFLKPILDLIRGILEVICCLMNPFCVGPAVGRLFKIYVPKFLSLLPPLAAATVIKSILKVLTAIATFILTEVFPKIELIKSIVLCVIDAFERGDLIKAEACKKQIEDLITMLANQLGIIEVIKPIVELIFLIFLATSGVPCGDDTGEDTFCCTEDQCPDAITNPPTGEALLLPIPWGPWNGSEGLSWQVIPRSVDNINKFKQLRPYVQDLASQLNSQIDEDIDEAVPAGATFGASHFRFKIFGSRLGTKCENQKDVNFNDYLLNINLTKIEEDGTIKIIGYPLGAWVLGDGQPQKTRGKIYFFTDDLSKNITIPKGSEVWARPEFKFKTLESVTMEKKNAILYEIQATVLAPLFTININSQNYFVGQFTLSVPGKYAIGVNVEAAEATRSYNTDAFTISNTNVSGFSVFNVEEFTGGGNKKPGPTPGTIEFCVKPNYEQLVARSIISVMCDPVVANAKNELKAEYGDAMAGGVIGQVPEAGGIRGRFEGFRTYIGRSIDRAKRIREFPGRAAFKPEDDTKVPDGSVSSFLNSLGIPHKAPLSSEEVEDLLPPGTQLPAGLDNVPDVEYPPAINFPDLPSLPVVPGDFGIAYIPPPNQDFIPAPEGYIPTGPVPGGPISPGAVNGFPNGAPEGFVGAPNGGFAPPGDLIKVIPTPTGYFIVPGGFFPAEGEFTNIPVVPGEPKTIDKYSLDDVEELENIKNDIVDASLEFIEDMKNYMRAIVNKTVDGRLSELSVDKNIVRAGGDDKAIVAVIPKDLGGNPVMKNMPDDVIMEIEIINDFGSLRNKRLDKNTGTYYADLVSPIAGEAIVRAKVNGEIVTIRTDDGSIVVDEEKVLFVADDVLPKRQKISRSQSRKGMSKERGPGGK